MWGHALYVTEDTYDGEIRDSCQLKEKLPALTDPSWADATRALAAMLSRPMTMPELLVWGRTQRISGDRLRNMLAWLSFHGHVYAPSVPEGELPRWRRTR